MRLIGLILLVSSLGILARCNQRKNIITLAQFTFAVDNNGPVNHERILYPKENKPAKEIINEALSWYLIDWNNNGIYNEINKDFIGVKNTFDVYPIIEPIKKENIISYNGVAYSLDNVTEESIPIPTTYSLPIPLSYVDEYVPISVNNGLDTIILNPDFESYDQTIIYFWATWCLPCVSKMEEAHYAAYEMKAKNIQFIPVAYKSDLQNINGFYKKHKMKFAPLKIMDDSAMKIQLLSVPQAYVYDNNGVLISNKFKVREDMDNLIMTPQ